MKLTRGLCGIGVWPPISTQINPTSLRRNGPHCVQSLHEVKKFLLNLVPSEPLALVRELAYFDNLIQLDPLLESVLDMYIHDLIICGLFHAACVQLCWYEFFCYVGCVQKGWKVGPKAVYIENSVYTKEWWNAKLKFIIPRSLADGVWPISE